MHWKLNTLELIICEYIIYYCIGQHLLIVKRMT